MSNSFKGSEGMHIDIPGNAVVSWSLVSQAAAPQRLQIKDSKGNLVVDTSVLSTTLSNVSSGTFDVAGDGKYRVLLPGDQTVMYGTATVNNGRQIVSETFLFGGEDSTDSDYNDAFALVTWFSRIG